MAVERRSLTRGDGGHGDEHMMSRLSDAQGERQAFKGIGLVILALGQLWFSFIFVRHFYAVSQMPWVTIDWRWVLSLVSLASFCVLAVEAWKSPIPANCGGE
jgi:hypothetical protein